MMDLDWKNYVVTVAIKGAEMEFKVSAESKSRAEELVRQLFPDSSEGQWWLDFSVDEVDPLTHAQRR